jgi:putative restriction endonuclease
VATEQQWQYWLERFYNLKRDKSGGHERPHKPVLLLTIFNLLDRGIITKNEVLLTPDLAQTFKRYFGVVRTADDKPTIENPFYFLAGDRFWQLVPKNGGTPLYERGKASGAPTLKVLREVYGRFDDDLWKLIISEPHSRPQLREALIARYFPEHREQISALSGERPAEPTLREEPPGRDGAFRHTILEIYDYRCAACGIRVKISDALSLVEAAHIIPFGISHNDKPDNGLALCPNHHWAMDRQLIAPCPDDKHRAGIWRVGRTLDARIEGQKDLVALHGQRVIPPVEEKFNPALESLRWREKSLSTSY